MKRVLFLCTGNACRSQMAESWARHLHGNTLAPYSAGTHPKGLDPLAVRVMREVGVNMAGQHSKSIEEVLHLDFDLVVTVCDAAAEVCPVFPRPLPRLHRSFQDPPALAAGARNEDEALIHYRSVRDQIRAFVESLPSLVERAGPRQ